MDENSSVQDKRPLQDSSPIHDGLQPLKEFFGITREKFQDIVALQQPAVLRGAARDWPLVVKSNVSLQATADYLLSIDDGSDVVTVTAEPNVKGRLGYEPGTTKLNHAHSMEPLAQVLEKILAAADMEHPMSYWIGGLAAQHRMPGLREANDIDLAPPEAEPHLTICNAVTIPAHIDSADNIAVVVAGRRRFTVFPPDQVSNLYMGPLDPTPAGVPISLVSQDAPDLEQYPRFEDAMRAGFVADLEPGDVIFIPYLWWHGVQSLDKLNVLVNFWWYSHKTGEELPWLPLLNASRHMFRGMPSKQRRAWRHLFDYWVFEEQGDPTDHLTQQQRPIAMTNAAVALFRDQVAELLLAESGTGDKASHCVLPAALTDAECDKLIALAEIGMMAKAPIYGGATVSPDDIRHVLVSMQPLNKETKWLFKKLDALFAEAAENLGVSVAPVREPLQILRYGPGDHFQAWHSDAGIDKQQDRLLSVSIELSEPSAHEGGNLEIQPDLVGQSRVLPRGGARFFLSRARHRVTPVISGVRWSLVIWAPPCQ